MVVELYNGEGLAPMVRASTIPLRTLAIKYGADFVYTEELVDRSITDTIRVYNKELNTIDYTKDISRLSAKTKRRLLAEGGNGANALLLRLDPNVEANKLICQIGTGETNFALDAALHVLQDVDGIDINMGCPKKFSVSGGMGSALLSDPNRACDIIKTLKNNLPMMKKKRTIPKKKVPTTQQFKNDENDGTHDDNDEDDNDDNNSSRMEETIEEKTPISAKIRILKDGILPTLDFITGLVNAGVDAIAIHGRKVSDDCINNARWEELEEILSIARSKYNHSELSLLMNGDFYTRKDIYTFQKNVTNRVKNGNCNTNGAVNGVLLARPALHNTSIFRKPPQSTTTNQQRNIPVIQVNENDKEFHELYSYDSKYLLDKTTVIQDYCKESIKYDVHYKNTKYVVCEMMNNRRAPSSISPYLKQYYPHGEQTIGKVCNCQSLSDICYLWNVNYTQYRNEYFSNANTNSVNTNINNIINNDNNQQTIIQQKVVLPDIHRYEDSYFLSNDKNKKEVSCSGNTEMSTATTTKKDIHDNHNDNNNENNNNSKNEAASLSLSEKEQKDNENDLQSASNKKQCIRT